MNENEHNCGNCKFFVRAKDKDFMGKTTEYGECHKHNPTVIPATTKDPNFGNILIPETVWPTVDISQWCGEWETKE